MKITRTIGIYQTLAACLLAFFSYQFSAVAQVDLTPRSVELDADEEQTHQFTQFSDGERKIYVDFGSSIKLFPRGKSRVVLVPQNIENSEIRLEVAASGFPTSETALKEFAVSGLPEDAVPTKLPGKPKKWMKFVRSDTWYIDLEFQLAAETYARRIVFWTFSDRQFRFIITARPAALNKAFGALKSPLLSWHWDDDSHLKPATITMDEDQPEPTANEPTEN